MKKNAYKITIDLGISSNIEVETKQISFRKLMKIIHGTIKRAFKQTDYINVQIEVMDDEL